MIKLRIHFIILILIIIILGITYFVGLKMELEEKKLYKVYYHRDGTKKEVSLEKSNSVEQALTVCLVEVKERLTLYVSEKDISDLFASEEAWEVVYKQPVIRKVGIYGAYKLRRIVFPLTGELASGFDSPLLFVLTEIPTKSWQTKSWHIWGSAIKDRSDIKSSF